MNDGLIGMMFLICFWMGMLVWSVNSGLADIVKAIRETKEEDEDE